MFRPLLVTTLLMFFASAAFGQKAPPTDAAIEEARSACAGHMQYNKDPFDPTSWMSGWERCAQIETLHRDQVEVSKKSKLDAVLGPGK